MVRTMLQRRFFYGPFCALFLDLVFGERDVMSTQPFGRTVITTHSAHSRESGEPGPQSQAPRLTALDPRFRGGERRLIARAAYSGVMTGLVPAIRVLLVMAPQDVDARPIGVRKQAVLRTAMAGHDD